MCANKLALAHLKKKRLPTNYSLKNHIYIYIYIYVYIYHHNVMPLTLISLTLSCHFSLWFIVPGSSSGLHPVTSHSCCMYVLAGRPALARPYVGIHRSTSLMSSSLILSCYFSLSFIAPGNSSGLHLVSSHSCCMYVLAGRPALASPYVGVHRSTSLMSSSLLLQQYPACLTRLTCIVFVMGGRWPIYIYIYIYIYITI